MSTRPLSQAELRKETRTGLSREAKILHGRQARRSGFSAIGRDEDGVAVETRLLSDLNILVDKWYVRVGFKKEDESKLRGDWKEIEAMLKDGKTPRKMTKIITHIIRAVRSMKHLREGYEREQKEADAILDPLDRINIETAEKCGTITNEEIDEIIAHLTLVDGTLAKKHTAVKRIIARARLAETIKLFEAAKGQKGATVGRACAQFTALRIRLGKWRDKQIAGIAEYNRQREAALRVERDKWLYGRLTLFSESPETVAKYVIYDQHKLKVLDELSRMIDENEPKGRILMHMEANNQIFRVPERERKKAEERIKLMEEGIIPKEGGPQVDYLIGHFAWLYRYVRDGQKGKAKAKIEHLRLFVNANKPGFILEELKKDPDPYLKPVLEAMEEGVKAFEAEDFAGCKGHFELARHTMEKIAHPKLAKP